MLWAKRETKMKARGERKFCRFKVGMEFKEINEKRKETKAQKKKNVVFTRRKSSRRNNLVFTSLERERKQERKRRKFVRTPSG